LRVLKKSQIASIYFKTIPFIIGEGLVLKGILSLFFFEAQSKSVISILLLFAGFGIMIICRLWNNDF